MNRLSHNGTLRYSSQDWIGPQHGNRGGTYWQSRRTGKKVYSPTNPGGTEQSEGQKPEANPADLQATAKRYAHQARDKWGDQAHAKMTEKAKQLENDPSPEAQRQLVAVKSMLVELQPAATPQTPEDQSFANAGLTRNLGDRQQQKNPLKVVAKSPYRPLTDETLAKINAAANLPTTMVDPKELHTSQDWVWGDNLAKIRGELKADSAALVIKKDGKLYLDDGNHRAVHALVTGQNLPSKVVDLDAKEDTLRYSAQDWIGPNHGDKGGTYWTSRISGKKVYSPTNPGGDDKPAQPEQPNQTGGVDVKATAQKYAKVAVDKWGDQAEANLAEKAKMLANDKSPLGQKKLMAVEAMIAELKNQKQSQIKPSGEMLPEFNLKGPSKGNKQPKFIPHPKQSDRETTIMVDPQKIDQSWKKSPNEYIGKDTSESEVAGRRQQFEDFLKSGKPIEASRANIHEGEISFEDGRHRAAVMRDQGIGEIALTVPKDQAEEIKRKFGKATETPIQSSADYDGDEPERYEAISIDDVRRMPGPEAAAYAKGVLAMLQRQPSLRREFSLADLAYLENIARDVDRYESEE